MSERRAVIWSEGLLLSHQHLQQADRAIRHVMSERLRALLPFGWGFSQLELDHDAARNGRVAISTASGAFASGTPFSLPGQDPLPASRSVEGHFDPRTDSLIIHLGLASDESGRAQRGQKVVQGAAGPRYDADTVELDDETLGQNPRAVEVQRRHFQLLLPDEALAEHETLPVGRLKRAGTGLQWDESFVPPALAIGASPALQRKLKESFERLSEHYRTLSGERAVAGGNATFAAQNAAKALRLMCYGRHLPALAHAMQYRDTHPLDVFNDLAELAGALCSMHESIQPADVPAYDHDQLEDSFQRLHNVLWKLIDIPTGGDVIPIPLERKSDDLWIAHLRDDRLVTAQWQLILGLRADAAEVEFVREIPRSIKIAAQPRIQAIIDFGLAGLPIEHLNAHPPSLPAKMGFHYYRLNPQGALWEGIVGARDLAVYVPGGVVQNPLLELFGVQR